MADLDWQSWSNYTNITFGDIISSCFDTDSLVWNFEKDEFEMIHFGGKGESITGKVNVYLSFMFVNDTPMIVFNQMKNENEVLLNNAINEIVEEYNVEHDLAMVMCDVVSGTMFLASFVRV